MSKARTVDNLWKGEGPVDNWEDFQAKYGRPRRNAKDEAMKTEAMTEIVSEAYERKHLTRGLRFPYLPTSKNVWQRCHWGQRLRTKDQWEQDLAYLLMEAPAFRLKLDRVKVHLLIFWDKPGPLPDHHNLDMAHEVIADGLVKAGVLPNDDQGRYERGAFRIMRTDKGYGETIAVLDWTDADVMD